MFVLFQGGGGSRPLVPHQDQHMHYSLMLLERTTRTQTNTLTSKHPKLVFILADVNFIFVVA